MISHLFLAAPNSDKPKLCVIQRKIEHDCTYSLPVGWRACFLVHTTVMAYGSKQLATEQSGAPKCCGYPANLRYPAKK